MIEGYFRSGRPYIDISVSMPNLGMVEMDISFAVDTGADRTLIGNRDALLLSASHGIDLSRLPTGRRSLGIGGLTSTRQTRVSMSIGSLHVDRDIPIFEPIPGRIVGLPSLLGLDILSHFALYMEERTNRVLLLERHEADSLQVA
ncbi:MAG: aspartyl protease family protein [Dehalococcoidia bacterium]|nr:aspartyl protease family protein [Dehalococcoidia bacterium]